MTLQTCRRSQNPQTIRGVAATLGRLAFLLALLVLTLHCTTSTIFAQGAPSVHPTESDVEAAYLYNFGKFVACPSNLQAETQATQKILC